MYQLLHDRAVRVSSEERCPLPCVTAILDGWRGNLQRQQIFCGRYGLALSVAVIDANTSDTHRTTSSANQQALGQPPVAHDALWRLAPAPLLHQRAARMEAAAGRNVRRIRIALAEPDIGDSLPRLRRQ